MLSLIDLRHLKEYAFKQPRFWGPHGKKKEDCENEITQNAFLWEEGERKGIEKSRRQNYMWGVTICSRFTTSIFHESEN